MWTQSEMAFEQVRTADLSTPLRSGRDDKFVGSSDFPAASKGPHIRPPLVN